MSFYANKALHLINHLHYSHRSHLKWTLSSRGKYLSRVY